MKKLFVPVICFLLWNCNGKSGMKIDNDHKVPVVDVETEVVEPDQKSENDVVDSLVIAAEKASLEIRKSTQELEELMKDLEK